MTFPTEVADAILDDLRGAGYYRDVDALTDLLHRRFAPAATREAAMDAAKAILADLEGAGYYRDRGVLAAFLESRFGAAP